MNEQSVPIIVGAPPRIRTRRGVGRWHEAARMAQENRGKWVLGGNGLSLNAAMSAQHRFHTNQLGPGIRASRRICEDGTFELYIRVF